MPFAPAVPLGSSLQSRDLSGPLGKHVLPERLAHEIAEAGAAGLPLALLVVDLDHFKSVNDAYGHARGDEVLHEFVIRLAASISGDDVIFRFGGDEFVVLLRGPRATAAGAAGIAGALVGRVAASPFGGAPPLALTASVGVACYPDDAVAGDALFRVADRRLYQAKRRGRGRAVADDADDARTAPAAEGRLLERDRALEAAREFLAGLDPAHPASPTLLGVHGSAGAGRTRLLDEIALRAAGLGVRTVLVRGTAAHLSRSYAALEASGAFGDAPETAASRHLAWDARLDAARADGAAGVVLLVDDAHWLDESSADALAGLLARCAPTPAALVYTAAGDAAPLRGELARLPLRRIELAPLSESAARSLLRTALRHEATAEFAAWALDVTGGAPRQLHALAELAHAHGLAAAATDADAMQALARLWDALPAPAESRADARGVGVPLLVGRAADVRALRELLAAHRLVTVLGPGGMGKTQLTGQVADELAGDRCFVKLAPLASAGALVDAIAERLGLAFVGRGEPRAQLLAYLRDRRLLLVLDNAEHIVESVAELAGELLAACPRVALLVTSQERLWVDGEVAYPLGGLPVQAAPDASWREAPAVMLFSRAARRADPRHELLDDDADAVRRICASVGGNALALEIAGSLTRVLSVREIAEQLAESVDVLASARRDLPERHRSVRGVCEYAWDRLPDDGRRHMAVLSLFRGAFTADAAARIAGVRTHHLAGLVDRSLVYRDARGRFGLHELLRSFAGEQLALTPAGAAETRVRLAAYYAEWLEVRRARLDGAAQREALDEVGDEIDNVRLAWDIALDAGDGAFVRRALPALERFLDARGWYAEGEALCADAERRLHADPAAAALCLARAGRFALRRSDLARADALLQDAHARLRAAGDPASLLAAADVLADLGKLAQERGDLARAEALLAECIVAYGTADALPLAAALNTAGMVAHGQGDAAEAERRLHRSLGIRRRAGDAAGVARCLTHLAVLADDAPGEEPNGAVPGTARVEALFREALAIAEEIRDRRLEAVCLLNLGVAALRRGRHAEAAALVRQSVPIAQAIGGRGLVATALVNLSEAETALGDLAAASRAARDALQLAAELHAVPLQLGAVLAHAFVHQARGDRTRAATLRDAVAAHPSAGGALAESLSRLAPAPDEPAPSAPTRPFPVLVGLVLAGQA